jgi:hypothetical protein
LKKIVRIVATVAKRRQKTLKKTGFEETDGKENLSRDFLKERRKRLATRRGGWGVIDATRRMRLPAAYARHGALLPAACELESIGALIEETALSCP